MENTKSNVIKKIRMGADACNTIKTCAEEYGDPGLILGLQAIAWGLEKIAIRAIEIGDPIILEELANLMLIEISDEDRRDLLDECREINPDFYNYDI